MATQPDGAFRTPFSGTVSDALLSADGSRLYVASDSHLYVVNVADGQIVKDYDFGQTIGGIDLSEDGLSLAVTANPPPYDFTEARFFLINTSTEEFTAYTLPTSGEIVAPFRDVVMLPDNKALFAQNGNGNLIEFDFTTRTANPLGVAPPRATLIPSQDHSEVLILDNSYSKTSFIYVAGVGITASHTIDTSNDPNAGASSPSPFDPVGAISPSGDQFLLGSTLLPFNASLEPQSRIPGLVGASGVTFSASGDRLYVYTERTIIAYDTSNWQAVASYELHGSVPGSSQFGYEQYGNTLSISADGRFLSAVQYDGVEVINLMLVDNNGTPGDDVIVEGFIIYGLAGDDTLGGGVGPQSLYGGTGDDTYYINGDGDQAIELPGEGYDRLFTTGGYAGANIEEITSTGNGDAVMRTGDGDGDEDTILRGGSGNDQLFTGDGDDQLFGNDGNDMLDGGAGADTMTGGKGDDVYILDQADTIVELAGEGTDEVRTSLSTYTLAANFENLTGTAYSDQGGQALSGNAVANIIRGAGGPDVLSGKGGDDTYYLEFGDTVVELAGEGHDTIHTQYNDLVLPDNVEDLVLGRSSDGGSGNALDNTITAIDSSYVTLYGLAGNDTLISDFGDDTLDGGTGADRMSGGTANDTYVVDNLDDEVIEAKDMGRDLVLASVDWTLGANVENLWLRAAAIRGTGNSGNNVLRGNDEDNTLVGMAGNDELNGGLGADTLIGGLGDDGYFVDNSADVVRENAGEGFDTVVSTADYVLGENVERLLLQGSAAIDGTGNSTANTIFGNGEDNVLRGMGGDDILWTSTGNDVLDGGSGSDIAIFANYRKYFTVSGANSADLMATGLGISSRLIDIDTLRFSDGDYVWDAFGEGLVRISGAAVPFGFTAGISFVTGSGFVGEISGNAMAYGTVGFQDIVVSGNSSILFDPSFNRGGDVIRLEGDAEAWRVALVGSSVILDKGTALVNIPVGPASAFIVFDDGARTLHIDQASGTARIGGQTVTTSSVTVDTPANVVTLPDNGDDAASARIYLSGFGDPAVGGKVDVIGTGYSEYLTLLSGTVTLDPSFNRGWDVVILTGDAEDFTATRIGSSVVLVSEELTVTIPVGTVGLSLQFDNAQRELVYRDYLEAVVIGYQEIGFSPVPLAEFG